MALPHAISELHEPLLAANGQDVHGPRAAGATGPAAASQPPPAVTAATGGQLRLTASHLAIDPEAPTGQQLKQEKQDRRRELFGLSLNALSTMFGTGMSLFAKVSGSQGIGVFEIVLTRSLILVLFTAPELLYYKINPFHDKRRRWLLVLRGVLGFCSVSSLYLAVALLPLADASVLSFLSPIFVAALSPLILKEKTGAGVLLGIPVAMVGVVLVAKPSFIFAGGGGISGLGVMVGIMQAFFNAMARMSVRALSVGSNERMSSIIFGQGIISCLGAGIMCAATKKFAIPTEAPVAGSLLVGGLLGYFYQLALTAGLQRARAAPAVAMSYLGVIWGILADIFVFHDTPAPLSLVGAAIICCSSFLVAFSMKKKKVHVSADERWKQSTARLQQEQREREQQRLLAASEAASEAASDVEEESAADWEDSSRRALKARIMAAAPAAAAAAEVQSPDTPVAPPLLPTPTHGSVDSLSLMGSSPDAAAAATAAAADDRPRSGPKGP